MLFRDSLHNICGLQCDYVTLPQIINSTSLFPCVWVDFAIALLSGIRPKRSCASWSGHFHWPYGFYSLSLIHQETTVRCINNLILPCCGSPGHAEKHQGVKHHCLRVEEWKRERGTPRHRTWEESSCLGSWSSVLVPSTGTSGSTTKAPSHNLINGLAAICYTARKKKKSYSKCHWLWCWAEVGSWKVLKQTVTGSWEDNAGIVIRGRRNVDMHYTMLESLTNCPCLLTLSLLMLSACVCVCNYSSISVRICNNMTITFYMSRSFCSLSFLLKFSCYFL